MTATDLPRLVFLPGLLNDARLWQEQVEGLAGIADCIVGDLTTHDSIAELAASVLEQAPSERFVLAGLSMGGYVALEVMRQAPNRVIALALLDTSARPDTPQATAGRRSLMQQSVTDFDGVVATLRGRLLLPAHAEDEAIGGVFTAMAKRVGRIAFLSQQTAILERIDSRPHLGRITCPTLVLCGREDAVTPLEVHEEMAAAIPGARLETVEDCGHLSAIEQSAAVTEALRQWLRSIT